MGRPSLRPFTDRRAAGRQLGAAVARLGLRSQLVVLGLPRGGVPVAFEVATALAAPLDVMVVRKVGMPGQPELALGAIAAGGVTVREPYGGFGFDAGEFAVLAERERTELERRERLYRAGRPPLELTGKTAVVIDDGLATGATMLAAVRAARQAGAAAVVVAAPVASHEAVALIGAECDGIAILISPPSLRAVGEWFLDFEQTGDAEVCELLEAAAGAHASGPQSTAA